MPDVRFEVAGFQLDDERFTLTGPAGAVHVEPQVFEVLHHLIVNRDRVVSKEELLDAIWGDRFVSESALTSRIKAARKALGDDGQAQRIIKTIHSRGYQLIADVRVDAGRDRRALPRLRIDPIGRDHDIERVMAQVSQAPLLTITGAGGIGKTTVALAAAERLQPEYPDGVVFADLTPAHTEADATRAVADAAGVEGAASATTAGLADHLASRPLLLVLDNCEHVVAYAAALVDRITQRGDTAHILATSREPLGVAGEHLWPLGPLHEAAPALFVERARAAEPRVDWDASDPAVIDLCRRLDHVPLALELAAGQLRRFDLAELNRRLDDRLSLLTSSAAGDGRHTTMEAAIDWSYRLLDDVEQRLLRHLSVHPASFDVATVEASAPSLQGFAVDAVLGLLVDKSLVHRLPGTGRYRLLETIRVFARDRLEEAGEAAAAFGRHRHHVRERVASTTRLDRWMSARLGAEYRTELEDGRQALRLSLERDEVPDAVEIAIGGSFLWRNAIGCTEGGTWTEMLLEQDLTPHDQLWVHLLQADVGQGRGDHLQMFGAASSASALLDHVDDPAGACLAVHYGALAHLTEPAEATGHLGHALDLARRADDPRLVTLIEAFLAVADLAAGHHDATRAVTTRLDRAASDEGYDRFILHWVGWMLALAEKDAGEARRWMSDQQAFLARTGIVETWITSFSSAFCDVLEGGDAGTVLARSLALADREGYEADADCVLVLAYAEMCAGRLEAAAELIGTAVRGRFNATAHYVLYRAVLDRPLREHLDAETLDRAVARGRGRRPSEVLTAYGVSRDPGAPAHDAPETRT
jgi:predicted ATPase